ncbi:unnamed protein product, partial [marine sediment metagenome]
MNGGKKLFGILRNDKELMAMFSGIILSGIALVYFAVTA